MAQSIPVAFTRANFRSILIDLLGLGLIYFVPTLSHLFSIPFYLVEPMRIMLILAIAHTRKENAYLLALTLPLFSFLVSLHPNFIKMLLITAELLLNVWLFYSVEKRIANRFTAMLLSILVSKVFYYLVKYFLISALLLKTGLVSTPLWLQAMTTIIFSSYIFFVMNWKKMDKPAL